MNPGSVRQPPGEGKELVPPPASSRTRPRRTPLATPGQTAN